MAVLTYKCPNCDGPLTWNGQNGKFVCDYCRGMFSEEELEALNPSSTKAESVEAEYIVQNTENPTDENNASEAPKAKQPVKMKLYLCPSCGAEIAADETTAATSCFYCHNPIVLSDRLSDDLTPDFIIPFAIDRKKAEEIFIKWVQEHKYIPSDFYSKKQIEHLSGVYFPYWVYGATLHSTVTGTGTRIRTWDAAGLRHTETKIYDLGNSGDMEINNLSRIALTKASRVLCESVMPFDMKRIKEFKPGYLQGYVAEARDISSDSVKEEAENEIRSFGESRIRTDLSGYGSLNINIESSISNGHFKYALMPVWTITYKDKSGKIYYFSINGDSGKTCGELPVDKSKLFKLFLKVFIPVFVILMLIFGFLL